MKTNANTRIRLDGRFGLCGAFLQISLGEIAYQSQRHITFIATEEIKLDGYRHRREDHQHRSILEARRLGQSSRD